MGGRDYVWHVQSAGGPAKGGQVSVDGWNDQRLVSRRGVIPWPAPARRLSEGLHRRH